MTSPSKLGQKDSRTINFLVRYGGGIGPNVWNSNMWVRATDIRTALDVAEPRVLVAGGQITAIEQEI